MAKRRAKRKAQDEAQEKRRALFVKLGWGIIVIVSGLFGYTYGYPIVAEGQVVKGVLTGLAYGGGAFLALAVSVYLNRKLKGL